MVSAVVPVIEFGDFLGKMADKIVAQRISVEGVEVEYEEAGLVGVVREVSTLAYGAEKLFVHYAGFFVTVRRIDKDFEVIEAAIYVEARCHGAPLLRDGFGSGSAHHAYWIGCSSSSSWKQVVQLQEAPATCIIDVSGYLHVQV